MAELKTITAVSAIVTFIDIVRPFVALEQITRHVSLLHPVGSAASEDDANDSWLSQGGLRPGDIRHRVLMKLN